MDDSDPPRKSLRGMTPEEVAELLAEYGASGPFDDLLDIQAVSNSVFDYGGRDVFLTGTNAETEAEVENDADGKKPVAADVDHTWPLESVVMHYTDIISSSTAQPLLEEVNKLLGGESSSVSLTVGPVDDGSLRYGTRNVVDDGLGIDDLDMFNLTRSCLRSNDDTELLKKLDGMLEEADRFLASRKKQYIDPMDETFLMERNRAFEEEERLWNPVQRDDDSSDDDDDDDDDGSVSLSAIRAIRAFGEERKVIDEERDYEGGETLFSFEYGPTLEEQQILLEWDNAVRDCEKRAESVTQLEVDPNYAPKLIRNGGMPSSASALDLDTISTEQDEKKMCIHASPAWEEEQATVLQSIATIEARDSDLEAAASRQLELHHQERQQQLQLPRANHGRLVFESFTKRVDDLLPPGELEVQIRGILAMEGESVDVTAVGERCVSSAERSRKVAGRESFRLICEERETLLMGKEDLKAAQEWRRRLEEQENTLASAIADFIRREETLQRQIVEEEEISFQQLCGKERDDVAAVTQVQVTRQRQALEADLGRVMEEHEHIRCEIVAREEEVAGEMYQEAQRALQGLRSLRKKTLQQISDSMLGCSNGSMESCGNQNHRILHTRNIATFTTEASWRRSSETLKACGESLSALKTGLAAQLGIGNSLRIKMLLMERCFGEKWLKEYHQDINDTLDLLKTQLRADDSHSCRVEPPPGSRPATAGSSSSLSTANNHSTPLLGDRDTNLNGHTSNCLNAQLARRLQPLALGGGRLDARDVAQRCHSLSFALEHISDIDFSSLATLTVPCAEAGSTSITSYVKELDLGGNALQQLQLDDALRVFPSLRSLNVSDNKIRDIRCRVAPLRGVSEAQANSVAQSARVTRLDISANALDNVEAVGKLLSYHLRTLLIFSNKVESLLPLAQCTRLECLEASRNLVTSLVELKQLRLLQTIDLSDNRIETIDPIAHQVLLQNLYLSRNKVRDVPPTLSLGFLRQLFLNGNALVALSDESFCWFPLLTVLHVENNNLRDVSGLRHCPRLTTVNLSFNQLQRIEDLLPLTACRMVQVLSVNENPFSARQMDDNSLGKNLDTVRNKLLAWFPHLSELNNEKVLEGHRQISETEEFSSLMPYCVARRLRWRVTEDKPADMWDWPVSVSADHMRQFCGLMSCWGCERGPLDSYADLFKALESDIFLTSMQREQDVLCTIRRRRYHDAVSVEEDLKKRLRDSKQSLNPITQRLSDRVEVRNRRESTKMMEQHLIQMEDVPRVRGNIHIVDALYTQRANAYKEIRAKKFICNWMYGCFLIKKAKMELEELRNSYENVQRRRLEVAARTIQPLWRGAVVRSRLKRIMKSNLEDDDDNFKPVSLDFLDDATAEYDGVGAVLQRVLENRGAELNITFDCHLTSFANKDVPPRTNSAGQIRVSNTHKLLDTVKRPDSQPQVERAPPSNGGDDLNEFVSSHFERRQKKMERSRREEMQREFLKDPLRIKRELQRR